MHLNLNCKLLIFTIPFLLSLWNTFCSHLYGYFLKIQNTIIKLFKEDGQIETSQNIKDRPTTKNEKSTLVGNTILMGDLNISPLAFLVKFHAPD